MITWSWRWSNGHEGERYITPRNGLSGLDVKTLSLVPKIRYFEDDPVPLTIQNVGYSCVLVSGECQWWVIDNGPILVIDIL
jgi:hypothetical protein